MKNARVLVLLIGVAVVAAVIVAAKNISTAGPASPIESLCGSQIC